VDTIPRLLTKRNSPRVLLWSRKRENVTGVPADELRNKQRRLTLGIDDEAP